MKKKKQYLIIMLVVVLAVVGVAAVMLLNPGEAEDNESSLSSAVESSEPAEEIVAVDAADVKSITVTLPYDEYVLLPAVSDEAESDEITFTIKGLEEFTLSDSEITTLGNGLLTISSTKSVGEKDDLKAFGLIASDDMESGDGGVTVTVETGSETITYKIGAASPESSGRYVVMDGENEVYIATISAAVFNKAYDFISKDLYSVADITVTDDEGNETAGTDEIASISISGSNYPDAIEIKSSTSMSGYAMTMPMKADASPDRMAEIVTVLKTVAASSVSKAPYEESDLSEYGLDEPSAKAEYVLNGEKHSITLGDRAENGDRYMIADDFGIIYTIADDNVSAWADSNVLTLRSSYILLPNIKNVQTLTLTVDAEKTVFDIERVLNEEKSTEEEPFYDLAIMSGGKEISYDELYQPLYKELIAISVLSVDTVEYNNSTPKMTVEYAYFDSSESDVVSFFELADKERYVVELNGEYDGIIRKTSLDSIIDTIAAAKAE